MILILQLQVNRMLHGVISYHHLLYIVDKTMCINLNDLTNTFQTPTMAPFCKDNEKYEVVNQLVKEIENIKNNKTKRCFRDETGRAY